MLRVQVVRSAGVPYYVRDLVPGRAEGTRVAGESPGEWTGGGSAVLGLRGSVAPDEFAELFAGRDPLGDRPLRMPGGERAVAEVDLLFCAPKSVSLLHLLGNRELSEATGAAHAAAVADARGSLERSGLGVRRTRGGVTRHLATTGAVAAGFVHRTSRALYPHLHTHLVAANVAQGVDGVWSAIDTRRLFAHRRALGAAYDASLRRELTERLGVAWQQGPTGRWDVAGIDPVLTRLFSQRAASIDEQLSGVADVARTPGRRRAAFHVERPGKDTDSTVEGLRTAWRRRAADLDLDTADLVRVVGLGRVAPAGPTVHRDELSARLVRLAGRQPTLGRADLVAAVGDAAPTGLRSAELDATVDRLLGTVPSTGSGPGAGRWATVDVVRVLDSSPASLTAGGDRAVGRTAGPVTRTDLGYGVTPDRPDRARAGHGRDPSAPGRHR